MRRRAYWQSRTASNGLARRLAVLALGLVLFSGFAAPTARAQEEVDDPFLEEEIETDRDSFTPATSTVDPRRMVVESSYSFLDARSGAEGHSYPELLIRYGLGRRWEARLGWNFETGNGGDVSSGEFFDEEDTGEDEARFLYGFKYLTSNQRGFVPQSSIIVQGYAPTQGVEMSSHVSLGGVWGWRLPNGWLWDNAVRYGTARLEGDNFSAWSPSTVLKVPLGERWNAHIEYFASCSNGKRRNFDQHYISFGPHVLIRPNLELGTRVGFGMSDDSVRFFCNTGIGLRY